MGNDSNGPGALRVLGTKLPEYPVRLKQLRSPPDPVFQVGRWDHPGPFVTIVGTRAASADGLDVARDLAAALAARKVAVLSGMARGIDAAAHEGALGAGGVSGAVLGTPVGTVYPPEHASLHSRLRRSLGLMSELRAGDPVTRNTFASRNRILAALADVVVVVQAPAKSGALITAKEAARLGRPVAAVPWDSRDPLGEGPHALIRSGRATLVRNADDVMELIAPGSAPSDIVPTEPSQPGLLSAHERALYDALGNRPLPLDRLAERSGLSAADLGVALLSLELNGLARREAGGTARRARR